MFLLVGMFFVHTMQWEILAAVPFAVIAFWHRGPHLALDFATAVPFFFLLFRTDAGTRDGLHLSGPIDQAVGFSVRQAALNSVKGNADAIWLAKLMVFNERVGHYEQYAALKQLAILHMMVVSGSHVSAIAAVIC